MKVLWINIWIIFSWIFLCCTPQKVDEHRWSQLEISDNQRFFQTADDNPFFWLGDTGWLLFKKLNREDAALYLEDRKQKGFNVIQVMLLHELSVANYKDIPALVDEDPSKPNTTPGSDPEVSGEYDFWDHVDYVIDLAAEKGLYMALVPVWGTPVSQGKVSVAQAKSYAAFLAQRYASRPNIIWLNGGDVLGDPYKEVWETIGTTIDSLDNSHLITFHPRGRRMSSEWFHHASWLDFNMFQSGHRNYDQDTAKSSHRFGPDNWKYVNTEYNMNPIKPTLDGEPSYEEIPYGLHDPELPRWDDADLRRYAYWSVFAGGAGFTYGHNSVMQFYQKSDESRAFGAISDWKDALKSPGATQMQHLSELMLSKSYFDRVPNQDIILNQGSRYDYLTATSGTDYAMVYTFTGRTIVLDLNKLDGDNFNVSWFDPSTGKSTHTDPVTTGEKVSFDPPGEESEGNDWVLVLERNTSS